MVEGDITGALPDASEKGTGLLSTVGSPSKPDVHHAVAAKLHVLLSGPYGAVGAWHSNWRYAQMLQQNLTARGIDAEILRPPCVFNKTGHSSGLISKSLSAVDKLIVYPLLLRRRIGRLKQQNAACVVHVCDHAYANYTRYLQDVPHVVTCHDVIQIRAALGLQSFEGQKLKSRLYQRMLLRGLKSACHVACVSETTLRELQEISLLPQGRLSVIYHGLNYPFTPMPPDERGVHLRALFGDACPRTYYLHVGANHWNKNRMGALRIFRRLRTLLQSPEVAFVMVGPAIGGEIGAYIQSHGLQSHVFGFTDIDSEALHALYSGASGLIFPSFYEGFGWPIIEAQACGCPVITTDRPPMNEIAGDAALFIDPHDPDGAAQTIVDNSRRLPELAQAGLQNVQRFSIEKMIDDYIRLYEQIAGLSIPSENPAQQACKARS